MFPWGCALTFSVVMSVSASCRFWVKMMLKTACERLLVSFMLVAATVLRGEEGRRCDTLQGTGDRFRTGKVMGRPLQPGEDSGLQESNRVTSCLAWGPQALPTAPGTQASAHV